MSMAFSGVGKMGTGWGYAADSAVLFEQKG